MLRKIYTVDEANSLLPVLEQVFRSIESHKSKIQEHRQKLEVLSVLWDGEVDAPSNPDYDAFHAHKRSIENEVSEIERLIQEEIVRRGIRFPSGGIENGLLDFPTTYLGRWVYLCWRSGEPELSYWHEVNAGFRGRQRLTDEHKKVMGKLDDPESLDDSSLDF